MCVCVPVYLWVYVCYVCIYVYIIYVNIYITHTYYVRIIGNFSLFNSQYNIIT